MRKRSFRWGCVLAVLLGLALLTLGGGAWWFFIGQYTMAAVPPASPVQVFLLSPSSGDEVAAGDFVPVNLQALAPEAISWSEVFVDGISLGAVTESPESVSWTWQAWPAGVHVLSGRAQAADGQMGESQSVIVNVLALSDTFQASAEAGQTLEEVGAKFGVPPNQMAGANPKIDPTKPLSDGQPLKVPTGGGAGTGQPQPPGGAGQGGLIFPFSIVWKFKPTEPVDKSYCYTSAGNGIWEKMPKQPFEFFPGLGNVYTQVLDALPPQKPIFQMQCWGWLGGALKYLGQAQAEKAWDGGLVSLIGQSFELTGTPQWPDGNQPQPDVITLKVPPPYGVREPKDAADCAAHAHPVLGAFVCKTLMGPSSTMKEHFILEWEWQPGLNIPGNSAWINEIDGYEIYEILPDTGAPPTYMKLAKPPASKVAAVPLLLGYRCYGVKAYAEGPQYGGKVESEMATYCPGQPAVTKKVILNPSDWMTTGGEWISTKECDIYPPPGLGAGGVGPQKPEILVGSYVQTYDDCYLEGSFAGGVKFLIKDLPPGAVVQKALLKFSKVFVFYGATGEALKAKPQICAQTLGKAVKDWTGITNTLHYAEAPQLESFSNPFVSIGQYMPSPIDVTSVVKSWVKYPPLNHGFIFHPASPPQPKVEDGDYGTGDCESEVGNFQLEIYYFAP